MCLSHNCWAAIVGFVSTTNMFIYSSFKLVAGYFRLFEGSSNSLHHVTYTINLYTSQWHMGDMIRIWCSTRESDPASLLCKSCGVSRRPSSIKYLVVGLACHDSKQPSHAKISHHSQLSLHFGGPIGSRTHAYRLKACPRTVLVSSILVHEMEDRENFEISTRRLKACCSSSELPVHYSNTNLYAIAVSIFLNSNLITANTLPGT